jgi:hypothetical protein
MPILPCARHVGRLLILLIAVTGAAGLGFWHGRQGPRLRRATEHDALLSVAVDDVRHARIPLPPPKLIRARGDELRIAAEATPGGPLYNPRKMLRVLGARDLFENEPRSESWAPTVESWLAGHIAEDLKAQVGADAAVTVECRTATCRIVISENTDFGTALGLIEGMYTPSASSSDSAARSLYFVYGPGERGPHSTVRVGDSSGTIAELQRIRGNRLRASSSATCTSLQGGGYVCR